MKRFITFTLALALLLFGVGFAEAAIYRNYNLGDDNATNYEVGEAVWTGNVFQMKTRAGGTGTLRSIQLMTGANTGIVIDSAGEVGIGTATPDTTLQVNGNFKIGPNNTALSAGSTGPIFANVSGFGLQVSTLKFGIAINNGTSPNFVIESTGNVGIGDATPTEGVLTVSGTGYFTNTVTVGTPTAAGHAATKSYVDSAVLTATSSQYWTLATNNLYPDSTAYSVAIGNTNPREKLYIDGGSNSAGIEWVAGFKQTYNNATTTRYGVGIKLRLGSDSGGGEDNKWAGIAAVNESGFANGTALEFYTNETGPRMVIDTNGNVGIGTTAPEAKLHVAGNSVFSTAVDSGGLKVQTTDLAGNNSIRLFLNEDDTANLYGFSWIFAGGDNPTLGGTAFTLPQNFLYLIRHTNSAAGAIAITVSRDTGNVGIADSTPTEGVLTVGGTGYFNNTVTVGTPTAAGHAATKSYVDSAVTGGTGVASACTGDATCEVNAINAQGGNITGVNKLTVTTIDPLYQIGDKKYSTYASAIAGGVKEEYVGTAKLAADPTDKTDSPYRTYSYTIDFDKLNDGSSLWVWRKTVDFSDDHVQVLTTPKKVPVPMAYEIDGNTITFRAPAAVEFSYRLVGNRFDWRDWPTLAKDQAERPSLIVK